MRTRLALWLVLLAGCSTPAAPAVSWAQGRTLVLASPDDPYLPLAEDIARAEDLQVVHRLDDALAENPEFLLWIVSPARLSDRALVDLGLAVDARQASPSIGIISGSTIENAHALWQRAADARGERLYAVNGEYPSAQIPQGRIRRFGPDEIHALTKAALVDALQRSDYLTFTGHGGAGYLSLAPGNALTAADIPALPPVVIGTASCQTFRPWRQSSIALAFVDRGASAYAGFAFSPNEGFLFGEFDGLPLRYTWDEFPIGHAMQVQTRGTLRGFAAFPYHLLLGDPRIALNDEPPYRVTGDRQAGDDRVLTITGAPAGVVPVRVSDGARYRFVEIPGVVSASHDDLFYNSRLQMANIGGAKYLLFRHSGGDFSVILRPDVPARHAVATPLRDSLDAALVLLQPNGGGLISIAAGIVVWLAVGWRVRRRRAPRDRGSAPGALWKALGVGVGLAALHGAYAWARLGQITVNEKPAVLDPAGIVGTLVLLSGAAFLYLSARSWRGRAAAIVLAILPSLAGAAFVATVTITINLLGERQLGASIYNYSLVQVWLIAAAFQAVLTGCAFWVSRRGIAGARA